MQWPAKSRLKRISGTEKMAVPCLASVGERECADLRCEGAGGVGGFVRRLGHESSAWTIPEEAASSKGADIGP